MRAFSDRPLALPEAQDVEGGHGLDEAFERQLAHRLDGDEALDGGEQRLWDEDLPGLGFRTETGGQVRDGADSAVVPAPLEAYGADGGRTMGDADTEVQIVAALAPAQHEALNSLPHGHRHAHSPFGRVGNLDGIVEEDHQPVAREVLKGPLALQDEPSHLPMVL